MYQGQNTWRLGFAKHLHSFFIGTSFWVRKPLLDDQCPGAAGNELLHSSQGAEQGNAEGNQEGWGTCGASPFLRTQVFTCGLDLGTCVRGDLRPPGYFLRAVIALDTSNWLTRHVLVVVTNLTIRARHKTQQLQPLSFESKAGRGDGHMPQVPWLVVSSHTKGMSRNERRPWILVLHSCFTAPAKSVC